MTNHGPDEMRLALESTIAHQLPAIYITTFAGEFNEFGVRLAFFEANDYSPPHVRAAISMTLGTAQNLIKTLTEGLKRLHERKSQSN